MKVLANLIDGKSTTVIPRFNKATDDRCPPDKRDIIKEKVDIIIFEGWCLGSEPQAEHELLEPVNRLEAEDDPDAHW
jgi:D-glycerate 3-kinase